MKSVHWTSYPEFNQDLINEDIEATVARMCNAIETGRLIRDKIKIPIKYPLRTVRLVDADPKVLDGFKTVQRYLCEEMNCINIELIADEATYVDYSCKPDNKLIGQVLKKKFDKKFSQGL
jgi:isoleucyl-tRNA synthetase